MFSLLLSLLLTVVAVFGGVLLIDRWIIWQAQDEIISDYNKVPDYDVAVVLGTSKYLGKALNVYYRDRIESAITLYRLGKVKQFLLSGDNAHRSYNEPWTMKRDLLRAGVPESAIHLDYAGFRTLDSIIRAKKIFGSTRFLIVTQHFHCERALFIARAYNIHAQCLAVTRHKVAFELQVRELLARAKAFLDIYVIHTQPKFLGPKEPITTDDNVDAVKSR